MPTTAKVGVYWPFKTILQGSGINLTETADTLQIATTGAGPGGGDMLISVFATNGTPGKVDHAVLADTATNVTHATNADHVPWTGIQGAPTLFPTDWSTVQNKPAVFPTTWALISGAPTVFPPSVHGASHVSGGTDPIPLVSQAASGIVPALSGSASDVFLGTGVFGPAATVVAATALLRAGDSLTPGGILVGTVDVPAGATAWAVAPFLAQSQTAGGFAAYGMVSNNYWGCALGAWQNGLYIATNSGSFVQLTDTSGRIPGSALVAGAVVANLGYTPIDGTDGGYYTPSSPVIFYKDVGLAASSYAAAPLRVQAQTAAGRPQISFLMPGLGASLYLETDSTFRWINSGGSVARLHDTLHPINYPDMAAGAAVNNIGYQPVGPNGGTFVGNAAQWIFQQDNGVGGASWGQALVRFRTTLPSTRPGMAFEQAGVAGTFFYFDGNTNTFRYVGGGGTIKIIATTN